jgi:hypothetical protein
MSHCPGCVLGSAILKDSAAGPELAACPGCGHDALKSQLAEARANARILAHCYLRDCRPPDSVVRVSADYPVEENP